MKNILQNLSLLFIGCIVAIVISESLLRIYNPLTSRVKGDKIVLFANEEYIVKNDRAKKLDKTIMIRTNSLGFRGVDPPEDFENYLTTVAIGGSTTECSFLTEGKTWTDALGRKLKENFKNAWINNAGLDGHSTFGHIVLVDDYIVKLRPKNVLFLIGINDEGNNEWQKDFEDDKAIIKDEMYFKSIKGFGRWLANHSEFFAVSLNIYRYYKASVVGVDHNTELDFANSPSLELSKDFIQHAIQKHKPFLPAYKERIKKLIHISRSHDIEPILITQPALFGDAIDDVTGLDLATVLKKRETENGELAWERLKLYNNITRQAGKEENVLVIDLAGEMPRSSRYYYDFTHYTNEGAEKVAEIIFKYLCPFYKKKYKDYLISEIDTCI